MQGRFLNNSNQERVLRAVFVAVLVAFVVLSLASAVTKIPGSDEAWFASPSLNLLERGSTGTSVLEGIPGIDRKTYWVMPLSLLTQAVWYKVAGFGLLQMRASSALWGLVALVALFYLVRELSGDRRVAVLTVALLALDYIFITSASFGRMDMMCAALGFAGLAVFLRLRERNFLLAIGASQTLVVLSGLTHFNGILYLAGLVFLTLYFDRARVGWRHVAVAAIPYVVGAIGWGLYILQDPSLFMAQFSVNATMGGRLAGLTAPWRGLQMELTNRYFVAFGLGPHSAGHSGPIRLKVLILLAYVVALVGALATREIREHRGLRALLLLTGIFFLIMAVLDGQKLFYYLTHIVPLYTAILAVWIQRCWTRRLVPRWLIALGVAGFLALQVGGALYRIKLDTYRNSYLPAVAYLQQHTDERTLIMGSAILGVELGFVDNLTDDVRLGYFTKKQPGVVVVDEPYQQVFDGYQKVEPDYYRHISEVLSRCRVVYDRASFKIYDCRPAQP